MNRSVRIALSVAVSILFLWLAVQGVDWGELRTALARAHYVWILPIFPLIIATLVVRGLRWQVLLQPVGRPPLRTLIAATNIGFTANMLLPLRVGEVIRPLLVSRKENLPLGSVLATILLERIFDMFTILFLFGVSSVGMASAGVAVSEDVQNWGVRLGVLALLLGGGVVFVRWQEQLALRIAETVLKPLPLKLSKPIDDFFRGFVRALEVLASPLDFLRLLGWSLCLWLVITAMYLFGLLAFDIQAPLFMGAVVVTVIVAIAISAPSAPGYIGAFQLGCILSLSMFGVDKTDALAYSIVEHVTQFIAVVLCGVYSLAREGMTLRQISGEGDGRAA